MMQAIAIATERGTNRRQFASAWCARPTHTGAVGRYAQWMAERGCAAVIMVAGPAFVAYHGARVASMGTSPIAIAVPSGGGADRARHGDQRRISNGTILQARATGAALPPGTALTAGGEPTTDPRQAEDPVAARRSRKARGSALMFEMLTSVLGAAPIQIACARPAKGHAPHPELRHPRDQYRGLSAARGFFPRRRRAGGDPEIAAAPGRIRRDFIARGCSGRTEARRREHGIPIPPKLWAELAAIAQAHCRQAPGPVTCVRN